MLFPSLWYLPLLPVVVWAYWRAPADRRWAFVALVSLAGLTLLLWRSMENRLFLAVLGSLISTATLSYVLLMRIRSRPSQLRFCMGLALPFAPFLVSNCNALGLCTASASHPWLIPLSIGFLALRQAHLVYEAHRGTLGMIRPVEYVAYLVFFPALVAGPLERYGRFISQNAGGFDWGHISAGAERIVIGCFKKYILADLLINALMPPAAVTANGFAHLSWSVIALACVLRLFYVYADFSGYSDMAIGTARLFGIRLTENFDYPLLRPNLAEFWRAWHRSLSNFARDHLYYPALARFRSPALASLITMLAIAAWHGISPGWLLWGVHHGVGLALLARFNRYAATRSGLQRWRHTWTWRALAQLLTWYYVTLGFAFTWHPERLDVCLSVYGKLLGIGL